MAINIQSIQFKHLLYDVTNKPAKAVKVQVQFYNVNTKSWLALTSALALTSGKLAYTLTIPSRISTKNQTIRVVREVLKSGGTPSFRIIRVSQSRLPEVIATTFNATIIGDSKITIDFNKSWLLDSKKYITKSDHVVIASEVPMFELMNSIRVIEEEKETAVAQVSGLNATIISLSDERESLRTQLLSAQNTVQNSSQEVADLNLNLQTVTANLANERALRETLETDKANLETALATQREEMETMEVSGDIRAIEIERDTAFAQISELNESVASLSNEREMLQTQLSTVQNDIETKEQQVADLSVDLQTVNANLTNERQLRQTLEADKANLETQLAAQRTQIENMEAVSVSGSNFEVLYNDLQQQVSVITIDKNNLEQQVADISIERDNLQQEKVSFLASISQLQTSVQREKALVTAKDVELQTQKTLVTTLERENGKLQEQLAEAQDFTVTDHPNKLSAAKVYSSIVNDVVKADQELINSKYTLANVSLNLKTTVEKGPDGTVFGLLDYESAKDVSSAAISDISIDIVPTGNTSTTVNQKMPNILGLTETAVRKVLLNNGLKLDAVYHATNDKSLIEGQSFKQSPAPDAAVEEGQEVIVIFAKPIN
ncbi:PASTA domain-containing protein [uncultured Kordia sp.]|uniref:PASTA domain-containing protein n=1 Tax=uncultured Kordia sp. TaxID=507699 RepID=UPI00260D076B|nr:PASTA domain-containing protein [uncultured Kordia sp.]